MEHLGPFILMFSGFVSIFSLIQYILSSQAEDADNVYAGLNPFLSMLIQTLRVSVGDLKNIEYKKWADDPEASNLEFKSSA